VEQGEDPAKAVEYYTRVRLFPVLLLSNQ